MKRRTCEFRTQKQFCLSAHLLWRWQKRDITAHSTTHLSEIVSFPCVCVSVLHHVSSEVARMFAKSSPRAEEWGQGGTRSPTDMNYIWFARNNLLSVGWFELNPSQGGNFWTSYSTALCGGGVVERWEGWRLRLNALWSLTPANPVPNAYVLPVASSAYATSPTAVLPAHSIPKLLLIMRSAGVHVKTSRTEAPQLATLPQLRLQDSFFERKRHRERGQLQ